MTGFDNSLREFQRCVDGKADLGLQRHRCALLKWLNAWGCRHLALSCHERVSEELAGWYRTASALLPGYEDRLAVLDDVALSPSASLFQSLSDLYAREGTKNGHSYPITFGPTAASKTLFALRPGVFVAWDEPMRRSFRSDDSGASYSHFLGRMRDELREIEKQAALRQIEPSMLPRRLGRAEATGAQLIGEYYWLRITRKVDAPGVATLREWLTWS